MCVVKNYGAHSIYNVLAIRKDLLYYKNMLVHDWRRQPMAGRNYLQGVYC